MTTLLLAALLGCTPKGDTDSAGPTPTDTTPPSDTDTDTDVEAATVDGCDGAVFLEGDADPAARGPWPVGVTTVTVGRLTTEVWYPAQPGSDAGAEPATYDIREALPPSQRPLIADEDAPLQVCDCARDLPLDDAHGPYPVAVFVHGTASFRTQSLAFATHHASRGAIVVAADHPGLWLHDILASFACPDDEVTGSQDLDGDVDELLEALRVPTGDLAFLAGHVDAARVALAGHSAGGSAVAGLADREGVRAVLPMASNAAAVAGADLASTLFFGALDDGVVPFTSTEDAYDGSPAPRRLVGIENTGHLAFSDLCEIRNDDGDDILTIATDAGVCGVEFASILFDCDPTFLDPDTVHGIVAHASHAVIDEALRCAAPADLSDLAETWPDVGVYEESL